MQESIIQPFSRFFETMNSRRYNLQSHYVFKGKTVFKCSFQKLGALQSGTPKNQSADCPKGSSQFFICSSYFYFRPFNHIAIHFECHFLRIILNTVFDFFLSIHANKVWKFDNKNLRKSLYNFDQRYTLLQNLKLCPKFQF